MFGSGAWGHSGGAAGAGSRAVEWVGARCSFSQSSKSVRAIRHSRPNLTAGRALLRSWLVTTYVDTSMYSQMSATESHSFGRSTVIRSMSLFYPIATCALSWGIGLDSLFLSLFEAKGVPFDVGGPGGGVVGLAWVVVVDLPPTVCSAGVIGWQADSDSH